MNTLSMEKKKIKFLTSFFISIFCLLLSLCNLQAQRVLTNTGKDFWFGFMDNSISMNKGDQPTFNVYITAPEVDAEVTIEVIGYKGTDGKPYSVTKKVGAGETYIHNLPSKGANSVTEFVHNLKSDVVQKNAVHVFSDEPINVYMQNYRPYTHDMSILYPSGVVGDRYIVSSYDEDPTYTKPPPGEPFPIDWKSEFLIVARFDSTVIQIKPTAPILKESGGTRPKGVPYNIMLMAGETYQAQSFKDLTGTIISVIGANTTNDVKCTPFAVFGGNQCTSVGECSSCDHIFEQMMPLPPSASQEEKWNSYVLFGSKVRLADTYRFMAIENGETNIEIFSKTSDPTFSEKIQLNGEGDYKQRAYQTTQQSKALYVKSDKRIIVSLYNQGDDCDSEPDNSDPFMIMIPPNEMMRRKQCFYTVQKLPPSKVGGKTQPWRHYTNIICRTSEKGKVLFDGQVIGTIGSEKFITVNGNPYYSAVTFEGGDEFTGDHYIESDSGVIAYAYGSAGDDSYGYTAAVSFITTPVMDSRLAELNHVECYGDSTGSVRFDAIGGLPMQYEDPTTGQEEIAYKAVIKQEVSKNRFVDVDKNLLKVKDKTGKLFRYSDIASQFKTKLDSIRNFRDTVTTFYGLWAGNYRAYIYPDSGCVQIQSFTVNQPPEVIIIEKDSICRQNNTYTPPVANVTGGVWCSENGVVIDGATGAIDLNQPALVGKTFVDISYKVKSYSQKDDPKCGQTDGCSKSMVLKIFEDPKPDFSYKSFRYRLDTIFIPYTLVEFTHLSPEAKTWEWDFGDGGKSSEQNPRHQYSEEERKYDVKLTVTDLNGCTGDSIKTIILSKMTDYFIKVPNIFTVNNDGINDRFVLDNFGIEEFTMTIYDRWGMSVFVTNNIDETWDGKVNGKNDASEGQYFWIFKAKTVTDLPINRSGSVTLVR